MSVRASGMIGLSENGGKFAFIEGRLLKFELSEWYF